MSILNKEGYSYNDLTIIPAKISNISSRSECEVTYDNGMLPIFASPMASVVDCNNFETFTKNKIIPILPRNINITERIHYMMIGKWAAVSLKEFEEIFINNAQKLFSGSQYQYRVVVDIANGHMKQLYYKCIKAKELSIEYGYKLSIMTGNIANGETYKWICDHAVYLNEETKKYECAIDYIRVGIGGGSGCITTSNTSIHYPQASLIDECYRIKQELMNYKIYESNPYNCLDKYMNLPKIVADGGIRNYDHVIKALALGADYVMIGSVFAQCIESAGYKRNGISDDFNYDAYEKDSFTIDSDGDWEAQLKGLKGQRYIGKLDVKFFGMASADGQRAISGKKTKTAEGITKWLPVKYTLSGWVDNMISYLRSAMSYTNHKTLIDFIGKPTLIKNSISEIQVVNR